MDKNKKEQKMLFETDTEAKDRRIAELEAQIRKLKIDLDEARHHHPAGWNASTESFGGC